jgi:hypothetical protein
MERSLTIWDVSIFKQQLYGDMWQLKPINLLILNIN